MFNCPNCGANLRYRTMFIGKRYECPNKAIDNICDNLEICLDDRNEIESWRVLVDDYIVVSNYVFGKTILRNSQNYDLTELAYVVKLNFSGDVTEQIRRHLKLLAFS